jgi:hypothetical protein
MTAFTAYLITWAVLVAIFTWLLVYRRRNLAAAVGVLIDICALVCAVILHSPILSPILGGSGAVGLVLWFIFWRDGRGGRGGRKRTRREAIGDESRQLRDSLVRRIRQRVTRQGWSPSPSR